jgi:hypothetical protein
MLEQHKKKRSREKGINYHTTDSFLFLSPSLLRPGVRSHYLVLLIDVSLCRCLFSPSKSQSTIDRRRSNCSFGHALMICGFEIGQKRSLTRKLLNCENQQSKSIIVSMIPRIWKTARFRSHIALISSDIQSD